MGATPVVMDMRLAEMKPNGKPMMDKQGRLPEEQGGRPATVMTKKQIRARARRKMKIGEEELAQLYKPLDEWDHEELARGRPRAKDGSFKGATPKYIDRAIHEQIVRRFEEVVKSEMNGHTVAALELIGNIIDDDERDERGKPIVAAGTKLDAAKFLIEHVIGKPKQRVETDISVKLQGLLGTVMVNPNNSVPGGFAPTQGFIEAKAWEAEDDYDERSSE